MKLSRVTINKAYNKIVRYVLGALLAFLKIDDVGYAALDILSKIVYLERKAITARPIPIEKQVFFLFANRMIVDANSARLLARNGFYGAGYTITAVMLRNITMYASLLSDKTRLADFWNEGKETYQVDPSFSDSFKESAIRNLAKSKFGQDAFDRSEFEKLLHGSCYAIRKYYSKKQINAYGKSKPLLMFGKFREKSKETGIKSVVGAIILDFLGVFFIEYQESGRKNYDDLLDYYYNVIRRAQVETARLEKEYVMQAEKKKGDPTTSISPPDKDA